jgi:hypothetical protein
LPAIVRPTNFVVVLAVAGFASSAAAVLVVSTAWILIAPPSSETPAVRAWDTILKPLPWLVDVTSVVTAPTWASPPTYTEATLLVDWPGWKPKSADCAVALELMVVPTAVIWVPPAVPPKA